MKILIFEIFDVKKAQTLTKKSQTFFFKCLFKKFLYPVYWPSRYLKGQPSPNEPLQNNLCDAIEILAMQVWRKRQEEECWKTLTFPHMLMINASSFVSLFVQTWTIWNRNSSVWLAVSMCAPAQIISSWTDTNCKLVYKIEEEVKLKSSKNRTRARSSSEHSTSSISESKAESTYFIVKIWGNPVWMIIFFFGGFAPQAPQIFKVPFVLGGGDCTVSILSAYFRGILEKMRFFLKPPLVIENFKTSNGIDFKI